MFELNFNFKGKEIVLKWSNVAEFKKFLYKQQSTAFVDVKSDDDLKINLVTRLVDRLNLIFETTGEEIYLYKTVLDVGSGISIIDLCLSQLIEDSTFYLLDKSLDKGLENFNKFMAFENANMFYNSWNVVNDCINSSDLDLTKFVMLSPEDNWPSNIDLVMSHASWCWHYPKDVYWQKTLDNLKVGGCLVLGVLNEKDKQVDKEISTEFNSAPVVLPILADYWIKSNHWYLDKFDLRENTVGSYYGWVRKK